MSQISKEGAMILDIIRNIALRVAREASNRKAQDVKVLDMRSVSPIADYFVICSCDSMVHLRAVTREILEEVKGDNLRVKRREGADEARWILVDLGDVIVHVFHHAEREFYDLDSLWADAAEVDWKAELGLAQDGAAEQTAARESAD